MLVGCYLQGTGNTGIIDGKIDARARSEAGRGGFREQVDRKESRKAVLFSCGRGSGGLKARAVGQA